MSQLRAAYLLMGPWLRELTQNDPTQREIADTFLWAISDELAEKDRAAEQAASPAPATPDVSPEPETSFAGMTPILELPAGIDEILAAMRRRRAHVPANGATILRFPLFQRDA